MALYLFITALTVGLSYFICKPEKASDFGRGKSRQELLNTVLLLTVFFVLFTLSALRVGIGNDYWTYRYHFLDILRGDTKISYEPGFRALVIVLQSLFGQDNYRVVFAVMAFLTCGFFIKGIFDIADRFVLSFFLFMANGFYFMSFSNVRYYFALAVCVYALKYVFEKDYVKFVIWILFAALFHKTALLVIPVYLIAYFLKWNKKTIWLVPAAAVAMVAGKYVIRKLVFIFYPFYEGDLLLDVEKISWTNIAKCGAILVLCLIFYGQAIKKNKKAETFFNLNLFAFLIYAFAYYIPETSRICYYMVVGHIFLIPIVVTSFADKKRRILFTAAAGAAYLGYLIVFLQKSWNPVIQLLPYLTWLFN